MNAELQLKSLRGSHRDLITDVTLSAASLMCVQVIEEIEEMMQDSSDMEAEHNPSQSDLSMLSLDVRRSTSSPSYESSECPLIRACGANNQ